VSNWTPVPENPGMSIYSKEKTLEYFKMAENKAEALTSKPLVQPLPERLWLVMYPGNRPYLGTVYEDKDTAMRAKRNFEVVVELRLADETTAEHR
jgi:hypothetical protein